MPETLEDLVKSGIQTPDTDEDGKNEETVIDPKTEEDKTSKKEEVPPEDLAKLQQQLKDAGEYRSFADDKIRQLTEELTTLKAREEAIKALRQEEKNSSPLTRELQNDWDNQWIEKIDEGGKGTIDFVRGSLSEVLRDVEMRDKKITDMIKGEIQTLRDELLESDPRLDLNREAIDKLLQTKVAGNKKEALKILEVLGNLKTGTSSPEVTPPGTSKGKHISSARRPVDIPDDPLLAEVQRLVGLKPEDIARIKKSMEKEVLQND